MIFAKRQGGGWRWGMRWRKERCSWSPSPAMMSHTSSFKDANRERKKRTVVVGPGAVLVPFYYFAKMQQQVISTDKNELSFQHQLNKATLRPLVNKVTPWHRFKTRRLASLNNRCRSLNYISHYFLLTIIKYYSVNHKMFSVHFEKIYFLLKIYQKTTTTKKRTIFLQFGLNIHIYVFIYIYSYLWASLVAQWLRIHLQFRSLGLDPWVGKILWSRQWQPTPVFLPGKSHGQRSLVAYSPLGRKRVGHDLLTKQQQVHIHTHTHTHTHTHIRRINREEIYLK